MKLSLTLHNKTYSVESEESFDGSNVYDLAEQFKGLLVSAGFHPSNVDSIFNLDYQWFTDEENQGNMQGHDVLVGVVMKMTHLKYLMFIQKKEPK